MKNWQFLLLISLSFALILLLNSFGQVQAKTAEQAIADIDRILGDPDVFVSKVWDSVDSFTTEHFGSMVVATGFGLAVRSIIK